MEEVVRLSESAQEILHSSLLNKGTAFTQQERDDLGLHGLLPSKISSVDEQIERAYQNFGRKRTPLGKYDFLTALLSRNELLFYQFIARFPAEILPFIYTPTVGEAAIHYSSIYFQQRGLYISYPLREKMEEMIGNCPQEEVDVVVVTDGERILGLGDQGIGGMTIPVGKLSLYTLFGGIHPARTLPILLDVGTNNPELLKDKIYLGWRHERVKGAEYDAFVERFVNALKKRFPKALLQWEDFGRDNARKLLDRYKGRLLSFNDDIQGTAAMVLSAILAAVKEAGQKFLAQKFAILGGGSAGTGIADMIVQALVAEGVSQEEARRRIFIVDLHGLLHFNSRDVTEGQRPYLQPQSAIKDWKIANPQLISMEDVIRNAHPTVLIGVSAQAGAFTKEMIQEMARYTERPIVFPLSNPTSKSECTPQELIEWTSAKAIFATGSPFEPVHYNGKTYRVGQCNNFYIFPGVGLGALAAQATKITDTMFLIAAQTLSTHSPALKDPTASLFPPVEEVRKISRLIASAVGKQAIQDGVSSLSLAEIEKRIDLLMWTPHYPRYTRQ
ncbi:MAG TPA: NAD-dependent malic enzyme [Chlamydiales bacterium]|nr:NAD-dependent malic enzyme [Chlamydiales bacterium]